MMTGIAITFVNRAEEYHLRKIEKVIRQQIPEQKLPAEIKIHKTSFEESQIMEREIDHQKRLENPNYKGAFHEKKERSSKPKRSKRKRGR